jgi:DNA-binding transcriptional MerR regulator
MDFQIPEKLYYKIGEVAKFTGIKTHVLRYWETEFKAIRPNKSRSNQRLYRKQDVELILRLKDLLYNQGFTIAGARKKLREKPAVKVAEVAVDATVAPAQVKTKQQVPAEASDQLALPLSGSYDPKLLKEIRQDLLRLKKSLEANP